MNRTDTLRAIKALPHMTATFDSDTREYRVTFKGVDAAQAERVASYTDDSDDALGTARDMSARRAAQRAKAFAECKGGVEILTQAHRQACAALSAIPGVSTGKLGLTPDSVKASPAYQVAKARCDAAFASLRSINAVYVKLYAVEIRAEREARRALQVAA